MNGDFKALLLLVTETVNTPLVYNEQKKMNVCECEGACFPHGNLLQLITPFEVDNI